MTEERFFAPDFFGEVVCVKFRDEGMWELDFASRDIIYASREVSLYEKCNLHWFKYDEWPACAGNGGIVLFPEYHEYVLVLSTTQPMLCLLTHLERFSHRGFGHSFMIEFDGHILCFYELGILKLDLDFNVVAHTKFESFLVPPCLSGSVAKYQEISFTVYVDLKSLYTYTVTGLGHEMPFKR